MEASATESRVIERVNVIFDGQFSPRLEVVIGLESLDGEVDELRMSVGIPDQMDAPS